MAKQTKAKTKSKTSIRPLSDRVLVRPTEGETQTKSGIYLPDTAKEKPMQGEVVAVGPGKTNEDGKAIPLSVKAGDQIVYGKYSGTEVELDGEQHVILNASELLAMVEA